MGGEGRVAIIDMHWFYLHQINYIKYIRMEIYQGCKLLCEKKWLVQTPRISSVNFTQRDLKTIKHVSKYHGISWSHPGEPFHMVFSQVRTALIHVSKIVMHGYLKSRIFQTMFKLQDQPWNDTSSIKIKAITLYYTLPKRIILDDTMFHLRCFYFESNHLPKPPFLSTECIKEHKQCNVLECHLKNIKKLNIIEMKESTIEEDVLMIDLELEPDLLQELESIISQ